VIIPIVDPSLGSRSTDQESWAKYQVSGLAEKIKRYSNEFKDIANCWALGSVQHGDESYRVVRVTLPSLTYTLTHTPTCTRSQVVYQFKFSTGGYLVRESEDDVLKNNQYRKDDNGKMFDRSEGRLASVGLIKVLETDMADEEVIPFKCNTINANITPEHKSKLSDAIVNVDQFSNIGGSVLLVDEGVCVLQVVTTTADPVVGSLEQLEQKSP
jgi:hypothetical protein